MPGHSCFLRDGGEVFHTYSAFGRGNEYTPSLYTLLDLTALGRQEAWEEPKGRAPFCTTPSRDDEALGLTLRPVPGALGGLAATGALAVAQVKRAAGCSVNDRQAPWVTFLAGTWRALGCIT